MSTDRIQNAWNLRYLIHAFLQKNKHSSVVEIFAAFPLIPPETIRKSLMRLRKDGDVCMVGRQGKLGRFSASSTAIRPLSETRNRLATSHHLDWPHKFVKAAQTRQGILDWLNEQGQGTARDAAKALNIAPDHAYRTLGKMEHDGEVMRHGSRLDMYFTPIKTESLTADEMRDRQILRKTKSRHEEAAKIMERKTRTDEPWRYVHRPADPIAQQEGIGSGRSRVWVGATAGML